MRGRAVSQPTFSVEAALKPEDELIRQAVHLVITTKDFEPLLEAGRRGESSVAKQRAVAAALRALTKRKEDELNRARLAAADGVEYLVRLLGSSDKETVEHAVTTLFNTSLTTCVRGYIFAVPGGIESIVDVLRTGSHASKENAAAALSSLADSPDRKLAILEANAIVPLVDLLRFGTTRGKKDAALALFSLSLHAVCRREMVKAGAVSVLAFLLQERDPKLEEKVVAVLCKLARGKDGREAIVEERAVGLLVKAVESGTPRTQEDAISALLYLVQRSQEALNELLRVRHSIKLKLLAVDGATGMKKKAQLMAVLEKARLSISLGSSIEHSGVLKNLDEDATDDEEDEHHSEGRHDHDW